MSAVRIALQALILPASNTSLHVPPASTEARPPSSLPLPPPSEGQGEALGVSRTSSSPSSCTRCRGGRGGGGTGSIVFGSGAVSADSSLTGGGGGGDRLRFPLPSLHLCSLALLPCLVRLGCWCVTLSHTHAAQGDCIGNAPALTHPMPLGLAQERLTVSDAETAHTRWVPE